VINVLVIALSLVLVGMGLYALKTNVRRNDMEDILTNTGMGIGLIVGGVAAVYMVIR
jgi:hypothetical protein